MLPSYIKNTTSNLKNMFINLTQKLEINHLLFEKTKIIFIFSTCFLFKRNKWLLIFIFIKATIYRFFWFKDNTNSSSNDSVRI